MTRYASTSLLLGVALQLAACGGGDEPSIAIELPDAADVDSAPVVPADTAPSVEDSIAPEDTDTPADTTAPPDTTAPADGTPSDSASADTQVLDETAVDSTISTADSSASDTGAASDTSAANDTSAASDLGSDSGPVLTPGDRCADATPITAFPAIFNDSTAGYGKDHSGSSGTGCNASAGPDRVYSVIVPTGKRLVATVKGLSTVFDPDVQLVVGPASNCKLTGQTCVSSDESGSALDVNSVSYANVSGAPQTVFIHVDSSSSTDTGGGYQLTADLGDVLPGDVCANATAVALSAGSATVTAQTTAGYTNDYGSGTRCTGTSGPDRVYGVVVPAGKRVSAKVTPSAGYDPSVNIVAAAACSVLPRVCLASADAVGSGAADSATWTNATGAEASVNIVVDGFSTSTTGTFTLDLAVSDVPAGDVCSSATVLSFTGGTASLPSQTTVDYSNDYGFGNNCSGTAGVDRAYRLTVPPGKRVSVTVTPTTSTYNPSVSLALASACDAASRVCLAGSDASAAGGADTTAWTNLSASPVDVAVIVDSSSSNATAGQGTFDLAATLSDPPLGDSCGANATVIASPGTLPGQTTVGFTHDYGSTDTCDGSSSPDRVYSITVPDNTRLTATVTPAAGFDAAINILDAAGCGATPLVCLAKGDAFGAAVADTASFANTTGGSKQVFIIVDGGFSSESGAFTLDTSTSAFLPGDLCKNATVIAVPGTLTDQTTVGYFADHQASKFDVPSCANTDGPDRAYAIAVAPGKTLSATVTPTSTEYDPAINLYVGASPSVCGGPSNTCGGSAGAALAGQPETAAYTNNTTTTQNVYIVVGSYGATVARREGAYSLTTAITP